jgi:uncharacterized protein YciI
MESPAMIVITLTYTAPLDEIDALMGRHVSWLKRHYKEGLFIASGRQVPRTGGVILARSGDLDIVRQAMDRDPFVSGGAATFSLIEFTPSMTAQGAEVLKQL